MRVIGITGGIGSGKSVVLNILKEEHEAYIVEADRLAHKLMEPDEMVYNKILETFGSGILQEDRTIDRIKLGNIVFHDEAQRKKLNNLTHPAVKESILSQIELQKQRNTKLFVIEAALLIQDGYRNICDELWYIYCDKALRVKRLMEYRNYTKKRAEEVINAQEPDEYFKNGCDKVINNQKDIAHVKKEIADKLYK